MTPKQIKEKMTQGVWRGKDTTYLKEEPFTVAPEDGGKPWVACERMIFVNDILLGSLWMQTASGGYETVKTVSEISADAAAIVSAVNGTYGVNISPDSVKGMYELLNSMLNYLQTGNTIQSDSPYVIDLTTLLTSAKL